MVIQKREHLINQRSRLKHLIVVGEERPLQLCWLRKELANTPITIAVAIGATIPRLAGQCRDLKGVHAIVELDKARNQSGRCNHRTRGITAIRSEEHTSELQSRRDLVCRL